MRRAGIWRVLLLALVCVFVFAWLPSDGHGRLGPDTTSAGLDWSRALLKELPTPATTDVKHSIASGESLARILSDYDVDSQEAARWCTAAGEKANLRRLVPGQCVDLTFADEQLVRLQFPLDDENNLVVTRVTDVDLKARVESLPAHVRVVGARGIVDETFYQAAQQAGVPDPVISTMVDLLAWKVDFNSDVRPGDHFRVLYQQRVAPDGRLLKPGHILAVEYRGRRASADAFLYETEPGKVTYLNADGKAVERAFLRYPLEFTRISSGFSTSRLHPILKQRRRHLGVDFAAPTGTPVRSVGAGTVTVSGWQGGLGRAVKIDHGGGLVTVYGHLRRISGGIRRGVRVERGQIVGAVGMSGMATGPHLHFAVFDRGRYVNPLRLKAQPAVVTIDREKFEVTRGELASRLRAIPGSCPHVLSTRPVTLSVVAQAWQLGSVSLTL